MRVYENITEVFGNTPLVRLNKITDGAPAQVFAKLEFYNPSSSVKDRLGIAMINEAESSGELKPAEQSSRQQVAILESRWRWWALQGVIAPSL